MRNQGGRRKKEGDRSWGQKVSRVRDFEKSWDLGSPQGRLSVWKRPGEDAVWVSLPSSGWVGEWVRTEQ